MPALVGGFGNNTKFTILSIYNELQFYQSSQVLNIKNGQIPTSTTTFIDQKKSELSKNHNVKSQLGPYLAGLIEGDGTFAVHDTKSTANKYKPMILVVFKSADLPLAQYLQNITKSGTVYLKPNRGYVLWQIQDIVGVYNIVNIINGYMRTPKIEALHRTINWINDYIKNNEKSKLPSTQLILSKIKPVECKHLSEATIDSNAWLSGFTDADGNFSINIHKRSNKNLTRVQLYYRLEIRQNYHRLDLEGNKVSYFSIMSILGTYFGVNVISKSRIVKEKQYYSFTIIAHNKNSLLKVTEYFNKFPLLSSKYLDYKDWEYVLNLQKANSFTTSYLDKALNISKNFNSTRTVYNWEHLNNCYLNQ